MKKISAYLLAVIMLIGVLPGAVAANDGGLERIRDYRDAGFTDVPSDWSLEGISTAYEIGLMGGKYEGIFDPKGDVTLAEAAMMAARLNDLWNGGDGVITQEGEKWYSGAVSRCLERGIVKDGEFSNYEALATRAQLAVIFRRSVPETALAEINDVKALPDVKSSDSCFDEIMALYRAGILTGSDEYGTFNPGKTISRAETAAIICRVARPDMRKTFTLKEKPEDLTVYTSNRILVMDGVELFGIYEINGEYYIPMEVLDDNIHGRTELPSIQAACYDDEVHVSVTRLGNEYKYSHNVSLEPIPAGRYAVAKARRSDMKLVYTTLTDSGAYNDQTFENAVCTIDGLFPMVKLSVFGIDTSGTGKIVWDTKLDNVSTTDEPDLVGRAMNGLVKSTPRETVRAIHDYVIRHVEYDTDAFMGWGDEEPEPIETKYELLNNNTLDIGLGFCGEYTGLFQDMCLRAGVPCIKLSGQTQGTNHTWNMVYVDGQWLYIDCTWDDPDGQERYDYFLVTPSKLAVDHIWYDSCYPLPQKNPPWDEWGKINPNNITNADDFRKRLLYDIHQGLTTIVLKTTGSGAYGGIECINILGNYGESCGTVKLSVSGNTYTVTISDEPYWGDFFIF